MVRIGEAVQTTNLLQRSGSSAVTDKVNEFVQGWLTTLQLNFTCVREPPRLRTLYGPPYDPALGLRLM